MPNLSWQRTASARVARQRPRFYRPKPITRQAGRLGGMRHGDICPISRAARIPLRRNAGRARCAVMSDGVQGRSVGRSVLPFDPLALGACQLVNVRDPRDMDTASRVSELIPPDTGVFLYQLLDRELLRTRFRDPIAMFSFRIFGDLGAFYVGDRFATRFLIDRTGIDRFCITSMYQGRATLYQNGRETTAAGNSGIIYRGSPGTRVATSDANARQNLWIEVSTLERALEGMLGERLRSPLEFGPGFDWTSNLAASLRRQFDFLTQDLAQPGGVTDNPIALASWTDLIAVLMLQGLPHNYQERLENRRSGAVPGYLRRAEDFMSAHAAAPIRMEQVAEAAGCGLRTLGAVFRQFRDTTPLAALHAIRLDHVRAELQRGGSDISMAEVARRYGFTNGARFKTAYQRRFGEAPAETTRRRSR
jgi:AraC-like DNA-binding protein